MMLLISTIFFIIDQHIAAANTAPAATLNGVVGYLCRRQRLHPLAAPAAPYHLLHRTAGWRRRYSALRPRSFLRGHSHQRHLDHR